MTDEVDLSAAESAPASSVKTFTQEHLSGEIVRAKRQAEDRIRAELETKHAAELERERANASKGLDKDALYAEMRARLEVEAAAIHKANMQRQSEAEDAMVAETYWSQVAEAKKKFSDYDEVTSDFEPEAFEHTIRIVASMDNGADLLYELNKNPSKLLEVQGWAERSPKKARAQLEKLARSIRENDEAQEKYEPTNPPLSQLKPKKQAGADTNVTTLKDLKSADWLRG